MIIFGSVGHLASVVTTYIGPTSEEAAIGNMQINEHGCVPKIKVQNRWHDTSEYKEMKKKFEADVSAHSKPCPQGLQGHRKEAEMIIALAVSWRSGGGGFVF